MKGIHAILLFMIFAALIVLAVTLTFIRPEAGRQVIETVPEIAKPEAFFDHSPWLEKKGYTNSEALAYVESPDFCEKVKQCIISVNLTGEPCVVDELMYGSLGSPSETFSFNSFSVMDCTKDLNYDMGGGVSQKFCSMYAPIGVGWNYVSDANGLYYDNCELVEGKLLHGDADVDESVYDFDNRQSYLYLQSGYWDGPGREKIVIGKIQLKGGECGYNFYKCTRPYLAKSEDDSTIKMFDIIRTLNIYSFDDLPYNIQPLWISEYPPNYFSFLGDEQRTILAVSGYSYNIQCSVGSCLTDIWGNRDKCQPNGKCLVTRFGAYRFNPFTISDAYPEYPPEIYANAIKEAFASVKYSYNIVNPKTKFYWASPEWDVERDASIGYDNCWNSGYDNEMKDSGGPFDYMLRFEDTGKSKRARSITYNCGLDGVCDGNITVNVALRFDKYDGVYWSGHMAFCDSGKLSVKYIGQDPGTGQRILELKRNGIPLMGTIKEYNMNFVGQAKLQLPAGMEYTLTVQYRWDGLASAMDSPLIEEVVKVRIP